MGEFSRDKLERTIAEFGVPEHLREGLVEHVLDGRPVGGFLTACLCNNFGDAVCRAGADISIADLRAIAKWLYNETPGRCHGSAAAVKQWNGLQ